MENNPSRKKGMVLISCLFTLVLLLGLSTAAFIRALHIFKFSSRDIDSLQAFYAAEAGISYAYVESSQQNFKWYTHENKDTRLTSPITVNMPYAYINDETGCYEVSEKNFQVKSYPEKIDGNYTGLFTILSKGEVNGISRVIEYRSNQESAYKFFFFYPTDHIFDSATFDGRNQGAIHVNGDIFFNGNPNFYFLTELASGSNFDDKGYIYRPLKTYNDWWTGYTEVAGFYNGKVYSPDNDGNVIYWCSPSSPRQIPWHLWSNINFHFETGNTTFRIGNISDPTDIVLPSFLNETEHSGAAWDYDKYIGNFTQESNKLAMHYTVDNTALINLAAYELSGHTGAVSLFDETLTITSNNPNLGTRNEKDMFKKLYQTNKGSDADNIWEEFWSQWKDNHANDYAEYHSSGKLKEGIDQDGRNRDWERRFFLSAYDNTYSSDHWSLTNPGSPYRVNMEWWEDLEYGTDRENSGDMHPAKVVDDNTGESLDDYFLNTKEQTTAWKSWLNENNLDKKGENQTLIKDASQGGSFIHLESIFSDENSYNRIKEMALESGIYIGLEQTGEDFVNQIPDCVEETTFYNAQHPARLESIYKPSNVLKVDISKLINRIQQDKINNGELANFNGIIYVDLQGYPWTADHYDEFADSVMVVKGAKLPEGGISIVTPNNVYMKGNYNLDPLGDTSKNRDADDPTVIQTVVDLDPLDAITSSSDLNWQPSEIITKRAIYTLSEDYSEPQTMPLLDYVDAQYYAEEQGYTDSETLDTTHWGKSAASWMPPATDTSWSSSMNSWFDLTGISRPSKWTKDWIESTWGTFDWDDPEVYSFLTEDEDPYNDIYILRRDIKSALYGKINTLYDISYAYNPARDQTDYQKSNPVFDKHIYNAAIVTPYSTDTYSLEKWDSNIEKVITGSFIQLPTSYKLPIPADATEIELFCDRYSDPKKIFNYEARFGKFTNPEDSPNASLTFGTGSSWREIPIDYFGS